MYPHCVMLTILYNGFITLYSYRAKAMRSSRSVATIVPCLLAALFVAAGTLCLSSARELWISILQGLFLGSPCRYLTYASCAAAGQGPVVCKKDSSAQPGNSGSLVGAWLCFAGQQPPGVKIEEWCLEMKSRHAGWVPDISDIGSDVYKIIL